MTPTGSNMREGGRSSLTLRLPAPLKGWLGKMAKENFTSQNVEIIRSIRERMEREAAQTATNEKTGQ